MATERIFNTPVNLLGFELRNATVQVLASAPASAGAGRIYFDSALGGMRTFNGTAWRFTDAALLTDGTIQNTALQTNPLARANHTGTQLAATISNLATTVQAYTLDQFAAPVNNVTINGQRLINVAAGIAGTDAVNLTQLNSAVQSASAGISAKASVVAVSTANVASLSGLAVVVDGVTLGTAGMRVLLTGQTTTSQNGPWVVAAGSWIRPTTDATNELETGALWFVEQGSANAASQWWLNSPTAGTTITPGTTAVGIVKFGASASYSAGINGGLQLIGSAFSALLPGGGGIVADSTGLHVDTTVVPRKFSQPLTTSATSYTVTHNLGTKNVQVTLMNIGTGDIEEAYINVGSANAVTIGFATAPAANAYQVTVIG